MNGMEIDDSRIETRFVWGRCAAKDARAMRELIRAFQSDGWPTTQPSKSHGKKKSRLAA